MGFSPPPQISNRPPAATIAHPITLTANQAYEFTITGLSGYGKAEIGTAASLAADGASARSTIGTGVVPAGGEQQIYFMPATSGTYYIAVSDPAATKTPETVTVAAAATTADYADNPTTTGTVTVGGPAATVSFTNSGQHDWFAVTLTANQAYEVSINQISGFGDFSDIGMNIGADSGGLAAEGVTAQAATTPPSNYANGFGNYYYYYMPATTGTYYIDAYDDSLFSTPAGFSLSIATAQADYTNNPSSPGTVAVGGEVSGQLANFGQNDWISMSLVANQAYELTITGLNNLYNSITLGTAAFLTANTTDGIDSNPLPLPPENQYLYFVPATSGTYYLDVNDYFADYFPDPYTVSLAATAADHTDNPTAPGTVAAGGQTTGTLSNIGQVDWIAVALVAGHNYEVTISGLSVGGETSIGTASSLASDGISASAITHTDIGIGGPAVTQYLNFTPATSGTYYIAVSDEFAPAGPEPYTVAVSCFAAGTRIATAQGEIRVEDLSIGDMVHAHFAGPTAVRWIGHRRVDCRRHPEPRKVWPVRISAGAFGQRLPCRELWLSPDHAVFVDDVLIPIKYLVNGSTVAQIAMQEVTYYHVELAQHDVLLADGLPAESFLPTGNRAAFENDDSPMQLHPDFASLAWEGLSCAPLVVTGTVFSNVERKVRDRVGWASAHQRKSPISRRRRHKIATVGRSPPYVACRHRRGVCRYRNKIAGRRLAPSPASRERVGVRDHSATSAAACWTKNDAPFGFCGRRIAKGVVRTMPVASPCTSKPS